MKLRSARDHEKHELETEFNTQVLFFILVDLLILKYSFHSQHFSHDILFD